VPGAFFEKVVQTNFSNTNGIVYILPETKPLSAFFPGVSVQAVS
jgi:hypothetical protein